MSVYAQHIWHKKALKSVCHMGHLFCCNAVILILSSHRTAGPCTLSKDTHASKQCWRVVTAHYCSASPWALGMLPFKAQFQTRQLSSIKEVAHIVISQLCIGHRLVLAESTVATRDSPCPAGLILHTLCRSLNECL